MKKNIRLLPLLAMLIVVPFIVFSKVVEVNQEYLQIYLNVGLLVDTMTYYKGVIIAVLGIVMTAVVVYEIYANAEMRKALLCKKEFKVLLIMLVLVLLAQLLSDHPSSSLWGFVKRSEGTMVWIAYIISAIYAMIVLNTKKDFVFLFNGYLVSLIIMGTIGVFEVLGVRLFEQEWFLKMITPNDVSIAYAKEKWVFLTATLFNSNYMGSYAAMGLSASIGALLWLDRKSKILATFSGISMIICLVGSRSSAGFVGAIVGFGVLIALYVIKNVTKKQAAIVALAVFTLFLVVISFTNGSNMFVDELEQLNRAGKSAIGVEYNNIWIKDNRFGIKFDDNIFIVEVNKWNVEYYDGYDNVIESNKEGDLVSFAAPYNDIQLEYVNGSYLVEYSHGDFRFYLNINSDNIQFIDQYGRSFDSFEKVPSFGFEGYGRLMSNRGYIWSRSLPLIKKNILIGSGADTFAYEFPQDDIVGKVNVFGSFSMIVDKPHNQYIQMAVNFGLVFVVLFVLYIGMLIVNAVKCESPVVKEYQLLLIGVVITYLVSAIFNDSQVGVAQVFWVMLATLTASCDVNQIE